MIGKAKFMKKMTKEEFIREVAKRANFTISDIQIIWDTIQEIFEDSISNEIELNIRGFGKLYFTEMKEKEVYIPSAKEYQLKPSKKKVGFKLASNLKELLLKK